ncbi:uncharacterized protein [Amphiura filiformis]|uniref:uncharacterized protein isoform X2 n=1 Tax=Amphiura filiformis TaxID=82378 RepID=UPI003B210082
MNIGKLRLLSGLRTRTNPPCFQRQQFCRAGICGLATQQDFVPCHAIRTRKHWSLQCSNQFSTSAVHHYARELNPIVYTSKFGDGQLPGKHIMDYVFENVDEYGDREALVDGPSGRSYSFSELKSLVTKCGSALARRGFKQGDVCSVYSPNNPEYFIIMGGVLSIGGILTTINPLYTVDELVGQLKHSDARYVITVPDSAANALKAKDILERENRIQEVFVIGEADGCTPFSELLEDDGSAFPVDVTIDEDSVAALLYSSGTTGMPKGVMLTHKNIVSNMWQFSSPPDLLPLKAGEDCVLGMLPFYHVYGIVVVLLNTLRMGVKVVTLPQFEPKIFLETMQNHKVSFGFLVPPLILFLAKNPMVDDYDLSALKDVICGPAPLSGQLAEELQKRLKVPVIRQGYGMTESGALDTMGPYTGHVGSAGQVLPLTQAKIVDISSGTCLSTGQRGELYISGPQVMKGYLKNPDATAACIDEDGFMHTGDIGYFSKDGNLYIIDRLKELIKYKAAQVAPAELEALLLTHPSVADAAVIGIPDEEAGELPKAFVVLKGDVEITEEELCTFVADQVAPHKKLRGGIEFTRGIPKTAAGKILRRQLRLQEMQKKR